MLKPCKAPHSGAATGFLELAKQDGGLLGGQPNGRPFHFALSGPAQTGGISIIRGSRKVVFSPGAWAVVDTAHEATRVPRQPGAVRMRHDVIPIIPRQHERK